MKAQYQGLIFPESEWAEIKGGIQYNDGTSEPAIALRIDLDIIMKHQYGQKTAARAKLLFAGTAAPYLLPVATSKISFIQ